MSTKKPAIRPIVEFFEVYAEESERGGQRYTLFNDKDEDGEVHPYYAGVKTALSEARGVYIFYDSRGRALYAGRTNDQNLWVEMTNAYNRDRKKQELWRVNHPLLRRREFDPEVMRRPARREVQLNDLATYFSAYEVRDDLIQDIEALLVRGFANDLLNTRMESFSVEKE